MRILWVKAGKLLPLDSGGRIRSYHIVRHLAKLHDVHLISYYGGARDSGYELQLARQLPGAEAIYTGAPESGIAQALDYLRRLPGPAPYAVSKFTDPNVRRAIENTFSQRGCDIAVCDFLSASMNFPHSAPLPVVLFQHNVETMLWRRLAQREMNPLRKLAYTFEAVKMASYERRALGQFDHVIAVSRQDRDEMLAICRECAIRVVPTGVDTTQYRAGTAASSDSPLVVFPGSMDWGPNIDAVEYFCRDIWPQVRAALPQARFQIVGRNPDARVRRLAGESVEVTGTVSSICDYLRHAAVVVVPLRIGGGTRLKIFEAMAMGKAVVSTSIGAEGLEVENGRDLITADKPDSFARNVIELLRNSALRRQYEQAAARLAARYDWSEIARQFADVLSGVIADFTAEAAAPRSAAVLS